MPNSCKIAVFADMSREYGRGLVRGVARYSRIHGPWTFCISPASYLKEKRVGDISWLKNLKADGIIVYDHPELSEIIAIGLPVILASSISEYIFPNTIIVASDSYLVGKKGAEHFFDRGFKHFAFCGYKDLLWSRKRAKGFQDTIAKTGFETYFHERLRPKSKSSYDQESKFISEWLKSLPKPVGLMTCNDDYGQKVIEVCRALDLKVPGEIAILGVDNDEIVCDLCNPPLSSIPLNTEKAGYDAADLLDRLIEGQEVSKEQIFVPILEPVERASTDIQATDDRDIVQAVRFIRQNLNQLVQVIDIANEVGLNRRTLERKFRKIVGHSINDEIRHARVQYIARILLETDLSISEIALKLGYTSADHIARYFRKEMGVSLANYRRSHR